MPTREARLYFALVRSGPKVARDAAEGAGLHRATAYRVLLRLLDRGLVLGDGRSPQKFEAIPPEILLQRLIGALREEEDVLRTFGELFARSNVPTASEGEEAALGPARPKLLAPAGSATHPALSELATARLGADVLVRPLGLGSAYRAGLSRTLGRLVRQGTRVRLITDATPGDHRFVASVVREAGEAPPVLFVRHFTPMVSHSYVVDARRLVSFPSLGLLGRNPDVAVAISEFARVRAQIARFDALWGEAAAAVGRPKSTRSYGWRSPPERSAIGSSNAANTSYLRTASLVPYTRPGDWTPAVPQRPRDGVGYRV